MNTRFMAWTVVVMLGQGLAGCGGSSSSSTPLSPSTPLPPPAPQPPVLALAGNYFVTFEADRSCDQLPEALKTRTYEASIGYIGGGTMGAASWFRADVNGAHVGGYGWYFMIKVTDDFVHFDFSDSFIVEEPEPHTYLTILGGEGGATVDPSNLSMISASFDGIFNYCVTPSGFQPPWGCPVDAIAYTSCRSKNSRWTLTRR